MIKNILYVDDIESNLFTMKNVLTASNSFSLRLFTELSAHSGLDVLLKEKIDLILLDIMMPEVDGFSMAKIIKSNKKTKDIPIIFVTAKTDELTIQKCFEIGGNDYINKPFNSIELLARIDFHLKLKDKELMLQREKEYAQSILDLQDNIIVVTDATKAINVNRSLLDFYDLTNLLDFQKEYECICHTFIEEEGYFHLGLVDNVLYWVDKVIELLRENDVIVKIKNSFGQEHTFAIKAKIFYDLYIVSLTDITTISEQSKEFEHEASFDNLTQIYNRNMFYHVMKKKLHDISMYQSKMCFVILDIDHFKIVNDTFGHLVGDEVLKHLTSLIKKHIRDKDVFARWGGEEFILALDVSLERGLIVIENLRAIIEAEEFEVVKTITCSFGITEFKRGDSVESMTKRADEALYEAKENGRNMICKN